MKSLLFILALFPVLVASAPLSEVTVTEDGFILPFRETAYFDQGLLQQAREIDRKFWEKEIKVPPVRPVFDPNIPSIYETELKVYAIEELIQIVQHIKPREKKGEDLAFIRFRRWDPAADRMVDAIKKEVALEALKRANFPVKDELGSTSESSDSS